MQMLLTLQGVAAVLAGYLLGSIPFGLLVTRFAGLGDIRKVGSGNIGATNVMRAGGFGLAFLVFLLDAGKGLAAVKLAQSTVLGTLPGPFMAYFAGIGALLGHMLPVWLGFRGGKGVATYLGVITGLFWPLALVFIACWLGVAALFRMSSLSALVGVAVVPVAALVLGRPELAVLLTFPAMVIAYAHRANIGRLLAGREPKLGK